jgi:hypothetical protein
VSEHWKLSLPSTSLKESSCSAAPSWARSVRRTAAAADGLVKVSSCWRNAARSGHSGGVIPRLQAWSRPGRRTLGRAPMPPARASSAFSWGLSWARARRIAGYCQSLVDEELAARAGGRSQWQQRRCVGSGAPLRMVRSCRAAGWEGSWTCPRTNRHGRLPSGPRQERSGGGVAGGPQGSRHHCRITSRPAGWGG